jgi:carotenoid 1,2-hydratase
VKPGGYAWWYLDAFSDDGRFGLTIIAFIGSVFSPYYGWKGRRDPLDHCAFNVALYGPRGARWAMTERRRSWLSRTPDQLKIGPSAMALDGRDVVYQIDETCAPLPRRLSGAVRLTPQSVNPRAFLLSEAGGHIWRPIVPFARVAVNFSQPDVKWEGDAYFDFNAGDAPLEADFHRWTWSRARTRNGAAIFYEAERRAAPPLELSLRFDRDGACQEAPLPPPATLPRTLWRVDRTTRSDADARIKTTFEDAPFYARSSVAHRLDGEDVISMHEALDLDRFAHPLVKLMLPFRIRRL